MIVAVTAAVPVFVAINAAISPEPLAASPIEVLSFVQLYTIVPPVVGLLKFIVVVERLPQKTWFATAFTIAVGLTVMLNVSDGPAQVTEPFV